MRKREKERESERERERERERRRKMEMFVGPALTPNEAYVLCTSPLPELLAIGF